MSKPIRASGGVVVRGDEMLLVHRPKYDDWTFPKGKARAGESDEDCALREVEEETGYRCALLDELSSTRYAAGDGRPKVVRYWRMSPLGESSFEPGHEVDEVRWTTSDEAAALLTYERDLAVLDAARRASLM